MQLGGEAQFKFNARLGGGICFDTARSGSKIRFGAACFGLLFARAVKFAACICILIRPQRGTHSLALTFLPLKFAVTDVSVHATLNFDFNGYGRQACSTKNQNLALLRLLIL